MKTTKEMLEEFSERLHRETAELTDWDEDHDFIKHIRKTLESVNWDKTFPKNKEEEEDGNLYYVYDDGEDQVEFVDAGSVEREEEEDGVCIICGFREEGGPPAKKRKRLRQSS